MTPDVAVFGWTETMMMTETMVAYHNDPTLKAAVLAQMAGHRADGTLIKGVYWAAGRGCAVGCLTHDPVGGHAQYPARWGIPEELARIEDGIFDHLPLEDARAWPERFLAVIKPGADLSGVYAAWANTTAWAWAGMSESVLWQWMADRLIASIKAAPATPENGPTPDVDPMGDVVVGDQALLVVDVPTP